MSRRVHKGMRGVDLFDAQLMGQLTALGHRVCTVLDSSFVPRLVEHWGARGEPGARWPACIIARPLFKPLWNGLAAVPFVSARRVGASVATFDATFVSNPARGITPVVDALRARGVIRRMVLQLNKVPGPSLTPAIERWACPCLAVSHDVLSHCPPKIRARTSVYYGIANAEAFAPPVLKEDDGVTRFVLLGALRASWKGAHVALEAWDMLAPDVRARCELHLASYQGDAPPEVSARPGVKPYRWLPAGEVPALLQRMDVMLVPSQGLETFSQAMVQGMLTGLPILTSTMGVLTEKIDVGGGLACADARALAEAMTLYARDPARRKADGQIARQTALARYVWRTGDFVERHLRGGSHAPT
jgi:glycosyltransferase involved in cell wall biosynthesis